MVAMAEEQSRDRLQDGKVEKKRERGRGRGRGREGEGEREGKGERRGKGGKGERERERERERVEHFDQLILDYSTPRWFVYVYSQIQ